MTPPTLGRALVLVVALACTFTVGAASRAGAHGAGSAGTETPNYVPDITNPGDPGLDWDVDIAHAQIRLTNHTDQTVIVYGYRGEPYLLFEPDGTVSTNANSPTTYLNQHRYGDAEIPLTADPAAEPDWQRAGENGTYNWWDHRAHWMTTDPPDTVTAEPDQPHHLSDWAIPLRVGDTDAAATGQLLWAPNLAWWPPILTLTTIATTATAAALTSRLDGDHWLRPAQTVTALIAVVAAANVIRGLDEALTVADTTTGGIVVTVTALIAAAAITALAWRGRHGRTESYLALLGAAFLTAIIFGGGTLAEITAPQLVTGLPEWTRRWTIAASYAILVPAGFAGFVAGRRLEITPIATNTVSSPAGPETTR